MKKLTKKQREDLHVLISLLRFDDAFRVKEKKKNEESFLKRIEEIILK